MKVIYTQHLKIRLNERNVPFNYPNKIYFKPEQKYFDNAWKSNISIRLLPHSNGVKMYLIAYIYDYNKKSVIIKTIHPTSQKEVDNRLLIKRYIGR